MGKGSKQRPTAATFYDNWDTIFGDKKTMKYECGKCGDIDVTEVHEEVSVDYEPMGDTVVPRREVYLSCEHCGGDVEDIVY